jgi:hypothetical protein
MNVAGSPHRRETTVVAGAVALALLLTACHAPLRPDVPPRPEGQPPPASSMSVQDLTAVVAADSRRSDQESDSTVRAHFAADANRAADACLALAPQAAGCLYYHAIALGLEARAHPTRALDLLKTMLDALNGAEAIDPEYDQAGPARVRALVLIKAPGWPVGPGDVDAGVTSARRAVSLRPQYPPNVLALAEALTKTGDAQGARDAYARAEALARALPDSTDRDDWLRAAEQGMQRR